MKKYFAGIDAGTTGASVIIFDEKGAEVSSGYSEYKTKHPHPGWVDQDMHELWAGVVEASKQATSKFKGNIKDVVSIGISSQRGSFVPIDENWEPLMDSIVWSDGRATKETQWIRDSIGSDEYYATSGLSPSSLWVYPKIKWVMDNLPDIYEKTWKFVNGQEWILNRLGSKEVFAESSALNYNGMFDINTLDYSDKLIEAINLDKDKLPPILHELRPVGKVSKEASLLTGFAEDTTISPGGGDQQCAAVGSGVNREGLAELSLGTAAVMVAQVDEIKDVKIVGTGVSFGSHAIPGKWDMEGTSHAAGEALRWWRDTYGQPEV
ncbi:MAG: xylulose kinase, partial [Clostridium sp.]|nr:xylulose kinase [Clostridium sp.]